jgi:hypothetical protein
MEEDISILSFENIEMVDLFIEGDKGIFEEEAQTFIFK